LQNLVFFIGLFCKRGLQFWGAYYSEALSPVIKLGSCHPKKKERMNWRNLSNESLEWRKWRVFIYSSERIRHVTSLECQMTHESCAGWSVLQCAAVCCSVLQCAAVRCSVLQCAAVRCSITHESRVTRESCHFLALCPYSVKWVTSHVQVEVCCSALHCVVVRCSITHESRVMSHRQQSHSSRDETVNRVFHKQKTLIRQNGPTCTQKEPMSPSPLSPIWPRLLVCVLSIVFGDNTSRIPHACRATQDEFRKSHTQCVAVCCSVLQCVAVCWSVLQCVWCAWCWQRYRWANPLLKFSSESVAVFWSALQIVAVSVSVCLVCVTSTKM